jgi:hypothetical protein
LTNLAKKSAEKTGVEKESWRERRKGGRKKKKNVKIIDTRKAMEEDIKTVNDKEEVREVGRIVRGVGVECNLILLVIWGHIQNLEP